MSEQIGRIEKPRPEEYKGGRKLYFVPLIFCGKESPEDYIKTFEKYWDQVETQLSDLESKLGKVGKVYHELIPAGGEDGEKALKELSEKSHRISQTRLEKGAQLEAIEDVELLTEFMDWSRCLASGLQNQKVFTTVYTSYLEAGKKRNEHFARLIGKTLGDNEIGILFMREGHQVQFPEDIQVFYVSPPALDEVKRWLRDHEAKPQES